jgi:hypothetical protein
MDILEQIRLESNAKNKQLLHYTIAVKAADEIERLREVAKDRPKDRPNDEDYTLLADGFDGALIGMGRQFNQELAVYDYSKCVEILMERDGMNYDDAVEFMEYNVVGSWMGKGTPVFVEKGEKE